MNYILSYNENGNFNGFFLESENNIPHPNIYITKDLYNYLIDGIGTFKIKSNLNLGKKIYTLSDTEIFEYVSNIEISEEVNSEEVNLEKQNAYLIKESIKKDIEIKDLNMSLAQTTINLINKDIEVKDLNSNMAHTTLNLVNKDIEIKDLQKDVANLILQTLGGK